MGGSGYRTGPRYNGRYISETHPFTHQDIHITPPTTLQRQAGKATGRAPCNARRPPATGSVKLPVVAGRSLPFPEALMNPALVNLAPLLAWFGCRGARAAAPQIIQEIAKTKMNIGPG